MIAKVLAAISGQYTVMYLKNTRNEGYSWRRRVKAVKLLSVNE